MAAADGAGGSLSLHAEADEVHAAGAAGCARVRRESPCGTGGSAPKRLKPQRHSLTMKESAGHGFTLAQCFRELIANAYDEHVFAQPLLDPKQVVIDACEPAGGAQPRLLLRVWNQGAAIDKTNFSIQKSKKHGFRTDRTRGFVSCIGHFGIGLARAAASLVSQDCELIYETHKAVLVMSSSRGSDAEHIARCNEAAAAAVSNWTHEEGKAVTHNVKLSSDRAAQDDEQAVTDAADAMMDDAAAAMAAAAAAASEIHLRFVEFELTTKAQPFGTKLTIRIPSKLTKQAAETWALARSSFIHHHDATPLFDVLSTAVVRSAQLPALQVFSKLAVPPELFAGEDERQKDGSQSDFVFINGLAYRVPNVCLGFTWNFIMRPADGGADHKQEPVPTHKLRLALSEKRQFVEWRPISELLDSLLKPIPDQFQRALARTQAEEMLADFKATRTLAQGRGPAANGADSEVAQREAAFSAALTSALPGEQLLLRTPIVPFLQSSISFSFSQYNDLSRQAVSSVLAAVIRLNEQVERKYQQEVKLRAEKFAKTKLAEAVNMRQDDDDDDDQARDDADSSSGDEEAGAVSASAAACAVSPPSDEEKTPASQDSSQSGDVESAAVATGAAAADASLAAHAHACSSLARLVAEVPDADPVLLAALSESNKPDRPLSGARVAVLDDILLVQSTALAVATVPLQVKITVATIGSPTVSHLALLDKARLKLPHVEWAAHNIEGAFSAKVFNTRSTVPVDVVSVLLNQGSGAAFMQSFNLDMHDTAYRDTPVDVSARRALLFILCKAVSHCGYKHVDVQLDTDQQPPQLTTSTDMSGQAPLLTVPYRGWYDHSMGKRLRLSDGIILASLRELTKATIVDHAYGCVWVQSAQDTVLQGMLLKSLAPALVLYHKDPAFVVDRFTSQLSAFHVVVLIDSWGRTHGGVPTFNMALCKALASTCKWGADKLDIWVTCVVAQGADSTDSLLQALPRLRVVHAPRLHGVSDAMARLQLVSRSSLPWTSHWPVRVDLVVGHDRWSGQVTADVAHRFQALSLVFAHTNPLAIGLAKTRDKDNYDAEAKHELLTASLKLVDQAVGCGIAQFRGLVFKHADAPGISFNAGYCSPSLQADRLTWMGEALAADPSLPISVGIVGRLSDSIKGSASFHQIMRDLTSSDARFSPVYVGVAPSDDDAADVETSSVFNSTCHPFTSDEVKLYETLRPCLCLLMPSAVESYGFVAAEAIGIGMPVVVSSRSGLGHRIQQLAANPSQWANGGNQHVGDWDAATCALRMCELATKIVASVIDANHDFPKQDWVARVNWIHGEAKASRMKQWMQLLRAALGDWNASVQTQFCDVMSGSVLAQRHHERVKTLTHSGAWCEA